MFFNIKKYYINGSDAKLKSVLFANNFLQNLKIVPIIYK